MVVGFATYPVRILGRAQTSGNPNGPTPPPPGLPALTGLATTVIGTDFIDIAWDAPAVAVEFIRVQCQLAGGDWSTPVANDQLGGDATAAEFSVGITANTYYDIRIRAEDGEEVSDWTTLSGVVTLPGAPSGLFAGPGGFGAISYNFTTDSGCTGKVYYNTVDDFPSATFWGTGSTGTITGLVAGDQYYIFATQTNASGESTSSSTTANAGT